MKKLIPTFMKRVNVDSSPNSLVDADFDQSPYKLVLLEEVLYNAYNFNKLILHVPTMETVTPEEFYQQMNTENFNFSYKYCVYVKLKEEGWYSSFIIYKI